MDRRQRKTREAIFNAFIALLSKKNYNNITVGEIIDLADVGRTTFYAHFETKDYLLKEFCEELFEHIFNAENESGEGKRNIFECDSHDNVFLHLFKHIKKNDNNLCKLFCHKNNELFLEYFRREVRLLVSKRLSDFQAKRPKSIPDDFWINHITTTLVETLQFWISNEMKEPPDTICEYFFAVI